MKRIFIITLICFLILTMASSCGSNQSQKPSLAFDWTDNLILKYNDSTYTVTKETLTENDIDKQIDTIAYFGHGELFYLFSIKNVNDYNEIAIQTKSGYYLATKDGKK